MIFTTLGAIKGARDDGAVEAFGFGTIGAIIDGVIFGIAAGITFGVGLTQEKQSKIQIEANVAESANFAKFTGNAFTVSKQNKEYYVDMFGVAIPEVGGETTFTQVTYRCDKDFYDKAFKYIDIDYKYGTSGQLIGAENDLRTPDFWFGNNRAGLAEIDLLKKLVDITEGEVVAKQFFVSADKANEVASHAAKGQYAVTGVGYVRTNETTKKASFTIDVVDVTKKSLMMKQITVEMPLTEEIAKDPTKAYEFYTNHLEECDMSVKTVAKENVMTIKGKDGAEYLAEMPISYEQ